MPRGDSIQSVVGELLSLSDAALEKRLRARKQTAAPVQTSTPETEPAAAAAPADEFSEDDKEVLAELYGKLPA